MTGPKERRTRLVKNIAKDVEKFEAEVRDETVEEVDRFRSQTQAFVDFIREKGVVGLAVGILIGTSITTLVGSIVSDLINPLVGLMLPSADKLTDSTIHIFSAEVRWGSLIVNILNFVVIALVVFFGFKLLKLDRLDKKKDKD